jgi:hypothetical protein
LFNTTFPNLLECLNEQMRELPLPRQRKKREHAKPLNL